MSADFAHLNRLDGIEYHPESCVFVRRIRFGSAQWFGEGARCDVEPPIAEELPRGVVQRFGPYLKAAVAQGGSNRRYEYQFLSQASPAGVQIYRSPGHAVCGQEYDRSNDPANVHASSERIRDGVERLSQIAAHQPFGQGLFIVRGDLITR